MSGLVPPDGVSDTFVKVFTQVTDERFSAIPVTACLVWDLRNTPELALLHIAEMLGLRRLLGAAPLREGLPHGWALIGARGTPGGLRAALEAMGYEVDFVTNLDGLICDGSILAEGEPYRCGSDAHWAVCQVRVETDGTVDSVGIQQLWAACEYFSRRSVRHVLTVTDAAGTHTYRELSLVPEAA